MATGPVSKQVGVRTAIRGTGFRDSRSQQSPEPKGQQEKMSNEFIQEVNNPLGTGFDLHDKLRELRDIQEAEIIRLQNEARENDIGLAETKRESQSLRQDLEEARSEQHRLEDELELRREEIERLSNQVRENQKLRMESEKLAESEVYRDL